MSRPVPLPLFAFSEEGDLMLEWCFGPQAGPGSWRVSLSLDPKEGFYTIVTGPGMQQTCDFGDDARRALVEALNKAAGEETDWEWWDTESAPHQGEE